VSSTNPTSRPATRPPARAPRPGKRNGRNGHDGAVLVCGLGRFGSGTADALARLGHEVLAIDRDPVIVQEWSSRLTRVVEADTTNL
jgi:trk system potassium uptake protein